MVQPVVQLDFLDLHYWGTTGDSHLSVPLHYLHHQLQLPDRVLSSPEVLWWLRWLHASAVVMSQSIGLVENFVSWSEDNHLQLKVTKTKELAVNLRKKTTPSVTPVFHLGGQSGHCRGLNAWGWYIYKITNWTGPRTPVTNASIFLDSYNPSTSAAQCSERSLSRWWPALSCMLLFAGTSKHWTNWSLRLWRYWGEAGLSDDVREKDAV